MPAAAEFLQDIADINLFQPRTGDHEDPALHAHDHEEGIEILHVLELVRQGGDIADEMVDGGMGDRDIDPADSSESFCWRSGH